MFLAYEIAGALGRSDYNKIKTGVDYDSTTKHVLEENYKIIKKMLNGEKIWGYLFLPLSGPTGLIVYRLTVDNNFRNLINSPHFLLLLCALTLIAFPFMFLAQRMNNNLFSKHIKELEQKIHHLSD